MLFSARRILLVEDGFFIALSVVDFLESLGCEIVGPALRLHTGLDLARTELLDAAVLDINIAGQMVWPIAEELERRNIPFLFLSAYSKNLVVPVAFASKIRLEKPMNGELLQRSLAKIFTREEMGARDTLTSAR